MISFMNNMKVLLKCMAIQSCRYMMPLYTIVWSMLNIMDYIEAGNIKIFIVRTLINLLICFALHYCVRRWKLVDSVFEDLDKMGSVDEDEKNASFIFILFVMVPLLGLLLNFADCIDIVSILLAPISLVMFTGYFERLMTGAFYLDHPGCGMWLCVIAIAASIFFNVEPSLRVASRLLFGVFGERIRKLTGTVIKYSVIFVLMANAIQFATYKVFEKYYHDSPYVQTTLLRRYGRISNDLYVLRMYAISMMATAQLDDDTRGRLSNLIR